MDSRYDATDALHVPAELDCIQMINEVRSQIRAELGDRIPSPPEATNRQMRIERQRWHQLLTQWEDLSDSIAALEAKTELLTGQDDTISLADLNAEINDLTASGQT